MSRIILPRRRGFYFPGGVNAGFDSSHPASSGIIPGHGLSAVASGSTLVNLLNAAKGTVTGTPTAAIDGLVGPSCYVGAGGAADGISFAGNLASTDNSITMAAIWRQIGTPINDADYISTTSVLTAGWAMQFSRTSGLNDLTINEWNHQIDDAGFVIVAGHAYFGAVSASTAGAGLSNWVLVDLSNGKLLSITSNAEGWIASGATSGTYTIGTGTHAPLAKMAAVMWAPTFLNYQQLLQWAADPWSFWYPDRRVDPLSPFLSATSTTAASPNFGWFSRLDESRLPPVVGRLPDQAFSFFTRSPNPVPSLFPPRTGENRERVLPPVRRPDEPFPWFVRSPNPVPQAWLPIAGETEHPVPVKRFPGEPPGPFFVRSPNPVPIIVLPRTGEDVERLPPIKENPDPAKQWFARSPSPVPITWLPTTGKDLERLPPIKRPPDEPGTWFRPSQVPVPTFLWFGGWDQPWVRPPPDQYVVTWPAKLPSTAVGISGMAWHISKEEMRPPRPPLNPDEFRQWFVRSPNPVLQTWLPQTYDQPPFPSKSDQYRTSWAPQSFAIINTIAGMAWARPYDQPRVQPPVDQYELSWDPPQSPLQTFMAQTNADDFYPLVAPKDQYVVTWTPRQPTAAASTIAGMAWWRPAVDVRILTVRSPDEASPFFIRSPNPVPTTWPPLTGENRQRDPSPVRRPDEAPGPWFTRSPSPVPPTWLPLTGRDFERLAAIGAISDRYSATWQAMTPPAFVGISGMAWFIPPEQVPRSYPGNTNQLWATTWAPQFIVQFPPTKSAQMIMRQGRASHSIRR